MMGSLFKTQEPAPVPPSPPVTVQDQVNGVEQVPVTNPDGSITYVTRALPLTAEQQAQKDQLNQIMSDSLAEIQKLSATDYTPDEATQKVLDQWQTTQQGLLGDQYTQRSKTEEERLAQRGLGDSTAAQEVRRQRELDQQKSAQNISLQKDELANQIKSDKLSLQQNLYNLASTQTNADAARTAQAAAKGQSDVAALNAQRQASILDYYNAQNQFSNSLSSGLGSGLGRSTGGLLGNVGGLLGSLFGGR
jgi:hypothetical protein